MYCPVIGRALINVPTFFLNVHILRWVTKYKYSGTILTDDLSDDSNMLRQRGICYARCNSLIRNLSLCSPNVKVKLFKTLCCIMYCCQIWNQYKERKQQVGYNHAFRRIMKYDRTCSASGISVANDVMSFNALWRNSLYNFKQRVTKSNTYIVNHVYRFTRCTSKIWKNSDRILCKYVIVIMYIGPIHIGLRAIMYFYLFYTTMSECMIFYGHIVPEINYYIILYYIILYYIAVLKYSWDCVSFGALGKLLCDEIVCESYIAITLHITTLYWCFKVGSSFSI